MKKGIKVFISGFFNSGQVKESPVYILARFEPENSFHRSSLEDTHAFSSMSEAYEYLYEHVAKADQKDYVCYALVRNFQENI